MGADVSQLHHFTMTWLEKHMQYISPLSIYVHYIVQLIV